MLAVWVSHLQWMDCSPNRPSSYRALVGGLEASHAQQESSHWSCSDLQPQNSNADYLRIEACWAAQLQTLSGSSVGHQHSNWARSRNLPPCPFQVQLPWLLAGPTCRDWIRGRTWHLHLCTVLRLYWCGLSHLQQASLCWHQAILAAIQFVCANAVGQLP